LKRRWSQKDLGIRTFAIAAMLGTLTSVTRALSKLPVIHQQTKDWKLTRKLAVISGSLVAIGLLAMIFLTWL